MNEGGIYRLQLVRKEAHHSVMEAADGYKNCLRPGRYFRVMIGPDGPICPGCVRTCRIPPILGLVRDDAIIMQKHVREN